MVASTDTTSDRSQVFQLLSNHRRRYAIHFCKREGGKVTLSDMAEQVAAWEEGKEIAELTSDERKRVYTSLQQTHLPTLDDAGMVVFENGEIELTERADELEVYMDVVPGDSVPWGVYYLGLSGLGFAVLGGVWLDVLPTGVLPAVGWAGIVLAVFAVSAVVHVYQNRKYRLGGTEYPQ
ncbi:hypothetical protein BRC83_07100 [Halobacteriales archaeon QS_1_68_17]|nr:MAG: hypothetical protein BRC83_07100 [Halobacteriales archaeon QS_1_68_17]